ncbi:MAG: hypothetical protein WBM13_10860 [Bacteroidia bacterium]
MEATTKQQNHYTAIGYTAAFLGLLLVIYIAVILSTSSKPLNQVNKVSQLQATSSM